VWLSSSPHDDHYVHLGGHVDGRVLALLGRAADGVVHKQFLDAGSEARDQFGQSLVRLRGLDDDTDATAGQVGGQVGGRLDDE